LTQPTTSIHAIYLQVRPIDIALVKFLFESYEEIAIVRTVDRRTAIIVVLVVPDFLPVARSVLEELRTQIDCVEVPAPAMETDDWLMREIDGED
jgi:hypothetical protein